MSRFTAQLAKTTLRITTFQHGEERTRTFYKPFLVLGRWAGGPEQPDLDLSSDNKISRNHARIWIEEDKCWIQDLGSKFGTLANGEDIRGREKVLINAETRLQLGETLVRVEGPFQNASGFAELAPQSGTTTTFEIDKTIRRSSERLVSRSSDKLENVESHRRLVEVLAEFAVPAPLDQLLRTIISRVVEMIDGAQRGTLVLRNPATDGFLLAAFVSPGEPSVSETLARRALKDQEAFVWQNRHGTDHSVSIQRHQIQSGMYAPLVCNGRPFGVICVDNPERQSAFSTEDLELLIAVADHAASAVGAGIGREIEMGAAGGATSTEASSSTDPKSRLRRDCVRAVILLAQSRQFEP